MTEDLVKEQDQKDICLVFDDRAEAELVLFKTELKSNGLVTREQLYKNLDFVAEDQLGRVLVNLYLAEGEDLEKLEPYSVQPLTRTRTWFSSSTFELPKQLPEPELEPEVNQDLQQEEIL